MKIISESKAGSKTNHKMEMTQEERQIIEDAGFAVYSCGTVQTVNKAEKNQFDVFVINHNAKSVEPKKETEQAEQKSGRYIELEVIADRKNLNHGKTWYCTSAMVDKNQLPPHFEGEMICYVYNN